MTDREFVWTWVFIALFVSVTVSSFVKFRLMYQVRGVKLFYIFLMPFTPFLALYLYLNLNKLKGFKGKRRFSILTSSIANLPEVVGIVAQKLNLGNKASFFKIYEQTILLITKYKLGEIEPTKPEEVPN